MDSLGALQRLLLCTDRKMDHRMLISPRQAGDIEDQDNSLRSKLSVTRVHLILEEKGLTISDTNEH